MTKPDRRPRLAERDGWRCTYCLIPLVPTDHPETVCTRAPANVDYWWLEPARTTCRCGEHPIGVPCTQDARWLLPEGYAWATVDHVIPQAHGGTDELENLVLACGPCNVRKGVHAA